MSDVVVLFFAFGCITIISTSTLVRALEYLGSGVSTVIRRTSRIYENSYEEKALFAFPRLISYFFRKDGHQLILQIARDCVMST